MKRELDDQRPIYIQIKEFLEDAILKGSIAIGEKAPSTNELAKFYQINPATARQGMNELVQERILKKQRGVGMFVTEDGKKILINNRQQQFFDRYIVPLKAEAEKLQMSQEQLVEMIERGKPDNEN